MEMMNFAVELSLLFSVAVLASFLTGYFIRKFFGEKRIKALRLDSHRKSNLITELELELAAMQDAQNEIEGKNIEQVSTLYTTLEASVHGIFIADSQRNILYFNNIFCTMWDLSEADISVGEKSFRILDSCAKRTIEPDIFLLSMNKMYYARDMVWDAQIRLANKKVFQASSSPSRGVDGTYYGRIYEFFDITESVEREEALHDALSTVESQYEELMSVDETLRQRNFVLELTENDLKVKNSLLSSIIDVSDIGMVFVDSDDRIRHFNNAFCEIWGLTEDIIYPGADGSDIINYCMTQIDNPDQLLSDTQTHLSTLGKSVWEEKIYQIRGGTFKRFSSPVHGPDGTYFGRLWEFFDITKEVQREQDLIAAYSLIETQYEKLAADEEALNHHYSVLEDAYFAIEAKNLELKSAHAELLRQNSTLSTLQEYLEGALCVVDENNRFLSFNQKFLDQWKISREELEQNPTYDYLWGHVARIPELAVVSDAEMHHNLGEEITDDQLRHVHDELIFVNGTTVERHSTPLIDENGAYYGRIWEFLDVTERVKREKDLIAALSLIDAKNQELELAQSAFIRQNSIVSR